VPAHLLGLFLILVLVIVSKFAKLCEQRRHHL
jgi:hypothetical protein